MKGSPRREENDCNFFYLKQLALFIKKKYEIMFISYSCFENTEIYFTIIFLIILFFIFFYLYFYS